MDPLSIISTVSSLVKFLKESEIFWDSIDSGQDISKALREVEHELECLKKSSSLVTKDEQWLMNKNLSDLDPEKVRMIAKDLRVVVAKHRAILLEIPQARDSIYDRNEVSRLPQDKNACRGRWTMAEEEYPDDELSTGCFGGIDSKILMFDRNLQEFDESSLERMNGELSSSTFITYHADYQTAGKGAIVVKLPPYPRGRLFVYLQSGISKNGFASSRALISKRKIAANEFDWFTTVKFSSLTFATRANIFQRNIRWLFILRESGDSGSSTESYI